MDTANSQSEPALNGEPADLESSLRAEMGPDDRLGSGVSTPQADSDLDFIEMTGLTAPASEPRVLEPDASDLDPNAPVSFYEKGVGDVDSAMDPHSVENSTLDDPEIVESGGLRDTPQESESVSSLKEIIADLSGEQAAPEPNIEEVNPLAEAPEASEPEPEPTVVETREALEREPEPEPTVAETSETLASSPDHPAAEEAEPVVVTSPVPLPPEPAPAVSPEPVAAAPVDVSPAPVAAATVSTPDLSEAETLLQELEAKERQDTSARQGDEFRLTDDPDWELPTNGEPRADASEDEEADASVYNKPASAPPGGRARRHRKTPLLRMIRPVLIVVVLAVAGTGLWKVFTYLQYQQMTASMAYGVAEQELRLGEHWKASKSFLSLANRFPNHPLKGDAEFMAAVALWSVPQVPVDDAETAYNTALSLFEQFILNHPNNQKVARARTMLGSTYFRLQRYNEAISVLGDPNRRILDPPAYLSTLRTLALCYIALGETQNARSAYLRAASVEGNYDADEDYIALASLYEGLARTATTTQEQIANQKRAVDAWDYAVRLPGILHARKKDIEAMREILVEQLRAAGAWDESGLYSEEDEVAQ